MSRHKTRKTRKKLRNKWTYKDVSYPIALFKMLDKGNPNGFSEDTWEALMECAVEEWAEENGVRHLNYSEAVKAYIKWRQEKPDG